MIALSELGSKGGIPRACPYCFCEDFKIVFRGDSIPTDAQAATSGFDLVKCRRCKTIYVNPAPAPETLLAYYSRDYYLSNAAEIPAVFERVNRMHSLLNREVKYWLSRGEDLQDKQVLEVGCANGHNLEPFLKAGWRVFAVEPNARLAAAAAAKGIDVHVGFVDSAKWDGEQFDIILLNHVLEHDYTPRKSLEKCVSALKHSGLLYVEIPVVETPSWKLFGRYWGGLEFPVHLTLLRKEHLLALVEELGCRIAKRKTRTLYGDVLRALERRFPASRGTTGKHKIAFLIFATILQASFITLNSILRSGEAFSVVAVREPN